MLAHHLRCWPNIETALGERPMFAGCRPVAYTPQNEHPPPLCSMLSPLQSLQRQYELTCKVSGYCIFTLHGSVRQPLYNMYSEATRYHVVFDNQLANPNVNKATQATLAQHWNTTGSMSLVYWSVSLEMWLTQIICVWLVKKDYLVQWCTQDVGHRH